MTLYLLYGISGPAVNGREINGDHYRIIDMEAVAPVPGSLGFSIQFDRPEAPPDVEFIVPPYGSRLYERPNTAAFAIPAEDQFSVPPYGAPQYGVATGVAFIPREASRVEFLVPRRSA